MKLVVIGGGGVRSPLLAKSLLQNASDIGVGEIVFMDTNEEKLEIFGKINKAIAKRINSSIKFWNTTDEIKAIKDADFVITTIRSGGDDSRVFDERTALNNGVIGQETTGAGGFAMTLRSVPILLRYCELIRKHAKENVLVFNFTNPSGMVTQSLRDHGYDFVYGICDAPSSFAKQLVDFLGVNEKDFSMECCGLNHLSWYRNLKVAGEDVYDKIVKDDNAYIDTDLRYFGKDVVKLVGNRDLPNEYLYFYYYRNKALHSIMENNITRGETISEINKKMLKQLKEIDIDKNPEKAFEIFMKHYKEREDQYFAIESQTTREAIEVNYSLDDFIAEEDEGGYAGVALNFIRGYVTDKPCKMVISIPNGDLLPFLNKNDVIEVSCNITKGKVTPEFSGELCEFQRNLIITIKEFEKMTIKAIDLKDRSLAIKALMIHPLVGSYKIASNLVDSYLKEYEEYIGKWEN